MTSDSQYNLKSADFPVLTGVPLRLFASALDVGVLRPLLLRRLLNEGGISKLRSLPLDEPATSCPRYPNDRSPYQPLDWQYLQPQEEGITQPDPSGFCTVRELAQAYRSGHTTPVAVAEKILAAVEHADRGERPLRALIACDEARLLADARAATERIAGGNSLGPLDGIPVACKDELDVQGYPTTVGTRVLGNRPATGDATVVARMRELGALVIGKANMHEIGINPRSGNPHHGAVRNPYHRDRDAGGSSSGSAAAVAAGLCPLAIGADGGGSIRIPAALCGVVGLKATYGRISGHGSFPLAPSVGHLGPIGATVEDVVLAYAAMAGPDPHDPNTLGQPSLDLGGWREGDLTGGGSPLRLGIYREWFQHADTELVACCEAMLDRLAGQGATIEEIEIPELDEMRVAHAVTILSEMAASMADYRQHWRALSAPTRINLSIGQAASDADYLQAQRIRTRAMARFSELFQRIDAIITPTTAVAAPELPAASRSHGLADLGTTIELMRFAIPGNLAGLPAISFPVGYTRAGLPIGLQVMGRPWEESLLFRIARVAEQLVPARPPTGYVHLLN